jgi:Divergent InlB B-repeat domain
VTLRASIALASTLAALGLLALSATPALAANQPLKVAVTGPGSVNDSTGAIAGCEEVVGTCEASYEEGTVLTLFANHNERTAFAGWENCETENGAECTLTIGAAPTEVKAKFTPIAQRELKVQRSGEGAVTGGPGGEFTPIECGTGTETCQAEYNQGATFILYANRDTHSKFTGWEECPNVLSSSEYGADECEVTLSAATEVKAKFAPIPQAELEVEVQGSGEVTSSPGGIACASGTCKEHFDTEGPEATVTLFATASPDNRFEKWEGECESTNGTECTLTISAAKSVKAVFAPILHQLTLTPSGPGEVSATTPASGIANCSEAGGTCTGQYQEASTVILTATPQPHNHVTWTGCKAEPSADECEFTIGTTEAEVKAAFQVNTHTLAVTPTLLGSVSASAPPISECSAGGGTCSGAYDEASTLTLTATPVAHYHSSGWESCPDELSASECEITIGTSDTLLKPLFAPNLQTLALTPTGPGSIRANSGAIVHCTESGGTCTGPYIEAATVTLIATPGPGQAVAWQGCAAIPSSDTCEVQIGGSETSVKASFAPLSHALTVDKAGSGQGQVACNGAPCATSYPEGTALTLTASPAAGSTFASWSGGGCSGTGTCHLTLQADTTITATFNANPPPPAEEKKPPPLKCHKGFLKKNGRCVHKPRPRHHKKKH